MVEPPNKRTFWIILAVAAVVILGLGYLGRSKTSTAGDRDGQATEACHRWVRDDLKAPTSARFEDAGTAAVSHVGDDYTVIGRVDADNSFGAPLRRYYTCVARFDPAAKTWEFVSVKGLS